ncbi:MAG: helix-turn-helix transcriptional regulator [Pseudomonadota bacterium]
MTEMAWFTDENSTFGDRLAAARDSAGLSQSELARRAGVRVSSIRSWENDQSEPRANTLQRVSGILGVSLMWLLAGEGDGVLSVVEETPDDLRDVLLEIRALRTDHARIAERLGRLEKRLRLSMSPREDA